MIENAPVLRQTPLRDVEVGHDFDLIGQRGVVAAIEHILFDQLAVDAQPDAAALLVWLEMNVARVLVESLSDQLYQKALSAADPVPVGRRAGCLPRLLAPVILVQQARQLIGRNRLDPDRKARQHLDLLFSRRIIAPGLPGAQHGAVLAVVGHEPVIPCLGRREQLDDFGRDAFGQVHDGQV